MKDKERGKIYSTRLDKEDVKKVKPVDLCVISGFLFRKKKEKKKGGKKKPLDVRGLVEERIFF